MRLSNVLINIAPFVGAAVLSYVAAGIAATSIEERSEIATRNVLDDAGHTWSEVQANGLQVILSGTARDEATRFEALSIAGGIVDAARIIDNMQVEASEDLAAPRFSAEILRNDDGISIIGLIPQHANEDADAELIEQIKVIAGTDAVTDLVEAAEYDAPEGWQAALDYALSALTRLPRSKVSVEAGTVRITAIADSVEEKQALEQDLARQAPAGLRIALDIAAPRPVITPFTLRYLLTKDGGRFDACSAETQESANRILAAADKAGLTDARDCTLGMGVPSPNWARAAELSLAALAEIGGGSVTFSDADISLIAAEGTDEATFDRVIGELESDLPEVFALKAVLPVPQNDPEGGPPEFVATLSPEGQVQLRGRLPDQNTRNLTDSFAKATFGSDRVYMATRLVQDLPSGWAMRVLAGLEALSFLENGAVVVSPDAISIRGITERKDTNARISQHMSQKLGEAQNFALDITYREPILPKDAPPDPETCEAALAKVQEADKIRFEPGSATIAADSAETMNDIADILKECGEIRLEIQGHTDSQGREAMNQQLSQARAQSVLNELRARRILTSSYAAKGYGESQPIADNDTQAGREANRRITFRLIRPAPLSQEEESTLDSVADETAPDTTDASDEETQNEQN